MSDILDRAKDSLNVTKHSAAAGVIPQYPIELVTDLVSELERVRQACKTLGNLTVQLNQMALDASGMNRLIDEDGDGDWAAVWENIAELGAKVERQDRERHEFTGRLGFGDNISEPSASLADMVDPIQAAFSEARDHQECPRICELCGERLASTLCPECHGSGCNASMCEASGAYVECEYCAGGGWVHEGCAEMTYAELVAELARLRAEVEQLKAREDTVAAASYRTGQLDAEASDD